MIIVGLDLSLTATGVADSDGAHVIRPPHKGMARLQVLREQIRFECAGAAVVAVEGYSFGSHTAHVRSIAELGGIIRLSLWEAQIPVVEIAPAQVKKYATGSGKADKDLVLAAAIRRGAAVDNHNAADAWWLRQMALAHYYPPVAALVPVPIAHRDALLRIDWPKLRAPAAL